MSGSGGGGGGSGQINYPAYIEAFHAAVIGTGAVTNDITDVVNALQGNSPWTGQAPYDPDTDITAMEAALTGFDGILAGITETTDWDAFFTQAETSVGVAPTITVADITVADMAAITGISEAIIVADVDAFADQLDDEITTNVLYTVDASAPSSPVDGQMWMEPVTGEYFNAYIYNETEAKWYSWLTIDGTDDYTINTCNANFDGANWKFTNNGYAMEMFFRSSDTAWYLGFCPMPQHSPYILHIILHIILRAVA